MSGTQRDGSPNSGARRDAYFFSTAGVLSAIGQNQPGIIEIKGLKTSHFHESKTAPLDRGEIGSMGHVESPQSEPANNDLQPGRAWMVAATNCERVGDQSRNGTPVSAASKTGHFDRRPSEEDTETFLRCLENGLRAFGGVPLLLNLDNLKAVRNPSTCRE
jgi:hypothetical protein